jgi:hypothetical protein
MSEATISVVASREVSRLKVRGSVRADTTSSPPRGTPIEDVVPLAGVASGRHPDEVMMAVAATTTASRDRSALAGLVKSWLTGQKLGRSKMCAKEHTDAILRANSSFRLQVPRILARILADDFSCRASETFVRRVQQLTVPQ